MGFLTKLLDTGNKGKTLMNWGGHTTLSRAEAEECVRRVVTATPLGKASVGKGQFQLNYTKPQDGTGNIGVYYKKVGANKPMWFGVVVVRESTQGGSDLSVALENWKEIDRSIILGGDAFAKFRDNLMAEIRAQDPSFSPV